MKTFAETVAALPDGPVKVALNNLCLLFGVHSLVHNAKLLVQAGFVTASDENLLQNHLYALYQLLRPDAVALVDVFDLSDRFLGSVLGRYDGRVYEQLFDWAKASPLNKHEVTDDQIVFALAFRGNFHVVPGARSLWQIPGRAHQIKVVAEA
jgi:acyl-CoA oxidase